MNKFSDKERSNLVLMNNQLSISEESTLVLVHVQFHDTYCLISLFLYERFSISETSTLVYFQRAKDFLKDSTH